MVTVSYILQQQKQDRVASVSSDLHSEGRRRGDLQFARRLSQIFVGFSSSPKKMPELFQIDYSLFLSHSFQLNFPLIIQSFKAIVYR